MFRVDQIIDDILVQTNSAQVIQLDVFNDVLFDVFVLYNVDLIDNLLISGIIELLKVDNLHGIWEFALVKYAP